MSSHIAAASATNNLCDTRINLVSLNVVSSVRSSLILQAMYVVGMYLHTVLNIFAGELPTCRLHQGKCNLHTYTSPHDGLDMHTFLQMNPDLTKFMGNMYRYRCEAARPTILKQASTLPQPARKQKLQNAAELVESAVGRRRVNLRISTLCGHCASHHTSRLNLSCYAWPAVSVVSEGSCYIGCFLRSRCREQLY